MKPLRTLLPCLLAGLSTFAFAQTATSKAAASQRNDNTPADAVKTPAAPAKDWNAQYVLGPDSQEKANVPKGAISKFRLEDSKTFPGYGREWALYVPSQYDGKKEACLMVFQDGMGYIGPKGNWRVSVVFDNLIAEGKMPVTIALFINPGFTPDKNNPTGKGKDGKPLGKSNRSFEYDSVTDKYVTFLLEEMIPLVESKGYKISKDPKRRAIGGASSGGICAFNAAWQRPDAFSKVFTTIGSFTNIRGGHKYPQMVMEAPKKDIRIFSQDGTHDLTNQFGSWPEANQKMADAWKAKGYDYQFVMGEGTHDGRHGGMLFPDAMKWLWRDVR